MTGKGKVNLSFNYPGMRQEEGRRRHSFTDSRDYSWDSPRGNAGGDATLSGFQVDALALGWMGQTIPFLGHDVSDFLGKMPAVADENQRSGGRMRRSPRKTSKGAALARKLRGLRGSPERVSSLQSCLRAQMVDAAVSRGANFVRRPLNFSTSVAEDFEGDDDDDDDDDEVTLMDNSTASPSTLGYVLEESTSKSRLIPLPKLPKFLKEYAAKISITRKAERVTKVDSSRMRVQSNDSTPSFSNAGNCLASPSLETLLFSSGLAFGVLFASSQEKVEAKRLSQLLQETQAELKTLKLELARRESHAHTNRFDSAIQESEPENQMTELEAELEAELDQLTGGDSVVTESQYCALDEMDVDASVVYGDLAPAGLPAEVEDSTDEDGSPSGRPVCSNNYAVSPRELTRLLRKLQTTRQEVLINELEEDLEAALSKLQSREKELEDWKDRVRRLTEGSFVPASGDESLSPRAPTEVVTLVEKNSSVRDDASETSAASRGGDHIGGQEFSHISTLGNGLSAGGSISEEEQAGLGSRFTLEPAAQGEVKSSLDTETKKQDSKEVGRKRFNGTELSRNGEPSTFQLQSMTRLDEDVPCHGDASSRDCKLILDNAQIITQLIDSVQGLESYADRAESMEMGSVTPSFGLFSSSVSISDTWDHPLDSAVTPEGFQYGANRGTSSSRAKLVVPHPSRRVSWNSDLGANRVLNRKLEIDMSSSLDANQCPDVVRCSEAMESSKSVSDISEAEPADYRTTEASSSAKYLESAKKPASEGAVGFGRAGVTTPVEKAKPPSSRTPRTAPVKWPRDLSPTVLEKIARWEGLMEGETPGPATGSDWECQSRASESEQQEYDDVNVFSEENLVLEAEEMLGKMLIKRIVEKSRLGSDSLVKKAQSALATLERDDGVEADVYHLEDTYMNDRTDSEADFSDDNQEKQEPSLLDAVVGEEYEFFRRFEVISNDRKAMKGVSSKGAIPGGVKFDTISALNLGSNAQPSPGSRVYRTTHPLSKDAERQPEQVVKQIPEPNINGRDNWLSRGVDISRGRDYRGDEVRSRRRL